MTHDTDAPEANAAHDEPHEPTVPQGVGPWPGGRASWPDDPRYDPELLEHGVEAGVVGPRVATTRPRPDALQHGRLVVRRAVRRGGAGLGRVGLVGHAATLPASTW